MWTTDAVNDLVNIITCNERYQRKLIFTNIKNQNNRVIYAEILAKLKERATKRGETITFNIQQTRSKFKRCISECKQAAMTILGRQQELNVFRKRRDMENGLMSYFPL